MIEIRQTEVYSQWFGSLRDRQARARIDARIRRLSLGNPGDVKPVGEGVSDTGCISCSAGKRSWCS
jgi:putative addiction module killer protein